MAKKTVFFSTMTFYDPLLYTYSCWSAATKIILCAYCLFCVLLRGTLHGSWSLVCLYWAPGSVVNFSLFFYFFPSFIPNSASGGRGLHFSYYFWFLVLFSPTLSFLPSERRATKGRWSGEETQKNNTVRQEILGGIRNWARIPFHGWRGHMGTHGGRICMVAIN